MLATLLQLQMQPQSNDLLFELTNAPIFLGLLKFLFILGAILYVAFSFVVVRQIALMRQTVVTTLSPFLQLVGYLHLIFSILVVAIFFLIL